MRRRAGSARFSPYWKIQRWEPLSFAWADVQRQFISEQAAREYAREKRLDSGRWRLMRVTEEGREPGEEEP